MSPKQSMIRTDINHTSKNNNLQVMHPVITGVGNRWKSRVDFTEVCAIKAGEEVF